MTVAGRRGGEVDIVISARDIVQGSHFNGRESQEEVTGRSARGGAVTQRTAVSWNISYIKCRLFLSVPLEAVSLSTPPRATVSRIYDKSNTLGFPSQTIP